jgi:serine/threonine-protein kinase
VSSQHPSPSPRQRTDGLPLELVAICEKAMNKDQAERFEHAGCMAEQLRAYRDGRVVSVYAYSPRELFRRFVARNKTMLVAGLVAVLALLAGTGLAVHWALRADAARQQAIEAHGQAERARMRAERAVEDVAGLANDLQRMADQTAAKLNDKLNRLTDAMRETAGAIGKVELTDRAAMRPRLSALLERFPECASFWTLTPPGVLSAVAPEAYEKSLGTDVTHQEHIRWIFQHQKPVFSRIFQLVEEEHSYAVSLQVPVFRDSTMVGTLATIIRPERVIPTLIPEELRLDKAARLWCIQEDGYVLYDNDLNQVGTYLFKDQTCAQYPELRRFAEQIRKEKTGVGYFRPPSPASTRMVERVAAWETLVPSETTRWKIVVVKPYDVDD